MTVNVYSNAEWPGNKLSNFPLSPFELDEVQCASIEGFVQALKFRDLEEQLQVCALHGIEAKRAGAGEVHEQAVRQGKLWWQGQEIALHSQEHYDLIERALRAKFTQHEDSRLALLETRSQILTHETGRPESPTTTLPAQIFISLLYCIRTKF